MTQNKIMRVKKQADEYTTVLAVETWKLLKVKGLADNTLTSMFLSKLMSLVVTDALSRRPEDGCTNEEAYEFAKDNFSDAKYLLQDAVAAAVGASLSKFSGRQVDYYCQISPVPSPKNGQIPC